MPQVEPSRKKAAQRATERAQARSAMRLATYAVPGLGEAQAAADVASGIGKVLTGDLTVIRWQGSPRIQGEGRKKVTLPGREYEVHVNPMSIGLGVLGLGVAAFVGMMAWNGVTIHSGLGNQTPIAGALKDTRLGGLVPAPETAAHRAQCDNTFRSFQDAMNRGDRTTARVLWDYNASRADGRCMWTRTHLRP